MSDKPSKDFFFHKKNQYTLRYAKVGCQPSMPFQQNQNTSRDITRYFLEKPPFTFS
jgi:hypothetical protein